MLETIDGQPIAAVPHRAGIDAIIHQLSSATARAIIANQKGILGNLPADGKTNSTDT